MDWQKIWTSIVDFFKANVWNIVWFVAILVIGIIVIKVVMKLLKKILSKTRMEKIAQQFLCTIVKFVLWLLLVLLLLSRIGVEISGILTACSAIILAVGMALQNCIANVANGIIIISSHLFKKGDYIIANGVEGSIDDINFLFTTLITVDNRKVTMPNSAILNGNVTNLGAYPKRRVDFTFSVAYESDVELVKKVVTDVMKSDGRVYLDPAPFCRLKVLNASSIDFFANCWCDGSDYWDVYYYIMENVYNEFKRHNISVPYNQLEVRERKDNVKMPVVGKGLPQRVEKVRKKQEESTMSKILNFELGHTHTAQEEQDKKAKKQAKKEAKLQAKQAHKEEKIQAKAQKQQAQQNAPQKAKKVEHGKLDVEAATEKQSANAEKQKTAVAEKQKVSSAKAGEKTVNAKAANANQTGAKAAAKGASLKTPTNKSAGTKAETKTANSKSTNAKKKK